MISENNEKQKINYKNNKKKTNNAKFKNKFYSLSGGNTYPKVNSTQ